MVNLTRSVYITHICRFLLLTAMIIGLPACAPEEDGYQVNVGNDAGGISLPRLIESRIGSLCIQDGKLIAYVTVDDNVRQQMLVTTNANGTSATLLIDSISARQHDFLIQWEYDRREQLWRCAIG